MATYIRTTIKYWMDKVGGTDEQRLDEALCRMARREIPIPGDELRDLLDKIYDRKRQFGSGRLIAREDLNWAREQSGAIEPTREACAAFDASEEGKEYKRITGMTMSENIGACRKILELAHRTNSTNTPAPRMTQNLPREHKVVWRIEIDAKNPIEAAQKALEIQRDPESDSIVFEVDGKEIDLNDIPRDPSRTVVFDLDGKEISPDDIDIPWRH